MSSTAEYQIPEYLVRREAAKTTDRLVQVLALAGAVACVVAASFLVEPIDATRREYQLTLDPETTRGLPPDMALLTKTGTFRALAIDFAFIRAEKLKQEGKYYELDKLSTLICKLSPRFPTVWAYCAWNQAYNISVTQYSPEGRWYWVKNGIELLRKEGIPYNPKSVSLYKELAWIFWHKVGDFLDDQHWNYKKELAIEVERVLGQPPTGTSEEEVIAWFRQITESPSSLEILLEQDQAAAAFVSELAEVGLSPDRSLLEFVARHLRSQREIDRVLEPLEEDYERTPHEARVELLADPEWADARDRLLACLRKFELHEQFNMDAGWMLQLMEDYGPLDWRSPFSHTLYWGTRGDVLTKGTINLNPNDSMNVVRYIFFALDQSVKRGKMVLEADFDEPTRSFLELLPDSRFIPHLHETYLRLGEEQFGDHPDFIPGTAGPNYMNGHFTFLGDWIQQLYFEGGSRNMELAREYYAYLRQYNRNDDGSPKEQYMQPLDEFVMRDFKDSLISFKQANMIIGAWIERSLKYLSIGDADTSVRSMEIAKEAWRYYMKEKGVDPGKTGRRSLPPLINMRAGVAIHFFQDPAIVAIHKRNLWHGLDTRTRQMIYDHLSEYFAELSAEHDPPWDINKAFPEPPGMEEFRARQPEKPLPQENIGTGEKAY